MATTKDQEMIYNDLMKYYTYINRLIDAIESGAESENAEEKLSLAESIITRLEKCTEDLVSDYINFIQFGNSKEALISIRDSLNQISEKIEEYRGRFFQLLKI